jgi:SSS family transporter
MEEMQIDEIGTLQPFDYIAIIVYMILMASIGLFLGRFVRNIGDYFKGGSGLSWLEGGISNFMTMFSTFVFVAYAGIAYEYGLTALTVIWCTVPPALVAAAVFARKWRRAGILTPVEFLETRFNAPVRQLFSWGGVGFKVLDNMVRLYAIGLFVSAATPLSLQTSVLFCGIIVILYTVLGGLWAVVVTDVIQFVILVLATFILIPLTLQASGGLDKLMQAIPEHFNWFNGPKGAPLFLLAYYTMVLIKYNANWAFIQRFYSVRTESDGPKLGILTSALFFIFPVIFLFPSIAAKNLIPNLENPEMAYVQVCLQLLPPGIMGLMLSAMFAATMSTLSAEYNVTAGVLTRDIYQRLIHPNASPVEALWVGRAMTLGVGTLVTIGALFVGGFGGAFEANKLFTGLFAIPMAIPLLFGLLLRKPQPWGALATVVVGISVGLVLNANPNISWEASTLIEIAVCLGVFVASGFLGNRSVAYENRVNGFFLKLATPGDSVLADPANSQLQAAMNRLYALALVITGALFLSMSIPSIHQLSGKLAVLGGIICIVAAVGVFIYSRNIKKI